METASKQTAKRRGETHGLWGGDTSTRVNTVSRRGGICACGYGVDGVVEEYFAIKSRMYADEGWRTLHT